MEKRFGKVVELRPSPSTSRTSLEIAFCLSFRTPSPREELRRTRISSSHLSWLLMTRCKALCFELVLDFKALISIPLPVLHRSASSSKPTILTTSCFDCNQLYTRTPSTREHSRPCLDLSIRASTQTARKCTTCDCAGPVLLCLV